MSRIKNDWVRNHIAQIKFDQLNSQNVSEFTQEQVEYTAADLHMFNFYRYYFYKPQDNANIVEPTNCSH